MNQETMMQQSRFMTVVLMSIYRIEIILKVHFCQCQCHHDNANILQFGNMDAQLTGERKEEKRLEDEQVG